MDGGLGWRPYCTDLARSTPRPRWAIPAPIVRLGWDDDEDEGAREREGWMASSYRRVLGFPGSVCLGVSFWVCKAPPSPPGILHHY